MCSNTHFILWQGCNAKNLKNSLKQQKQKEGDIAGAHVACYLEGHRDYTSFEIFQQKFYIV
jgi:hypothetical protein